MGKKVFNLKLKDANGNVYEPDCLKGKDATSIYEYSKLGGNTDSESVFMTKFNRSVHPYPVGSIYMSGVKVDPAALFGGKWEEIHNKFLFSAGTSYENGEIPLEGAETVTLSIDELPSHEHPIPGTNTSSSVSGYNPEPIGRQYWAVGSITSSSWGGSGGVTQPHNNMPPYIVRYIWKRTE